MADSPGDGWVQVLWAPTFDLESDAWLWLDNDDHDWEGMRIDVDDYEVDDDDDADAEPTQTIDFTQVDPTLAYQIGEAEKRASLSERKAIIAYLIKKNIIRESMFGDGWVAYTTDGEGAVDLWHDLKER
jgi:hypothetical protein